MAVHVVVNKETGLEHTVNDGHYALTDPAFEVVKPKPAPKKKPAAKKVAK